VQAKQDDGQLVLSVSDTGQGIPDDEVLTIFDEYRQVEGSDKEHKGTGLGLSITKQFAELLGESISVESQMGKGSTFTMRVPMSFTTKNILQNR
jgi:signal transduction histidine kinase